MGPITFVVFLEKRTHFLSSVTQYKEKSSAVIVSSFKDPSCKVYNFGGKV